MTIDISSQSLDIIKKHQNGTFVDVDSIAFDLKIKVFEVEGWPDNLCGKIVKDSVRGGESGYAIFVNKDHSLGRKRFTVAHEIAHFLLHREDIGDGVVDDALYRSKLSGSQETMANKFAADILMPWELINQKIAEGYKTVEDLAKVFKVSEGAMSIRLGVPAN
jgi:Zn-dependent peptidase ImmA (M78 family)